MIDGSLHVVNKGARDQEKHLLGVFIHAPNIGALTPFTTTVLLLGACLVIFGTS